MALAWNTREWLAHARSETSGSKIEFHFLRGKALFDETGISPDRHHSSAGEWVMLPRPSGFYSVSVVTRPVYAPPQELCLSFSCFSRETRTGKGITIGPPVEEVALEFGALLSVLVREPLLPLGVRRQDDKPINYLAPYGALPRRPPTGEPVQTKVVNSLEFAALLKKLARANAGDVRAALSAFAWFERLTHYVIEEFLVRIIAPEVRKARLARQEAVDRMLKKIATLSANTQKSLETLTRWTARF